MSTRSVIARVTGESTFAGSYHHSDGYPRGLGQALVKAYLGYFQGDLDAMLKYLIDDHPAGWSCILGADFSLPAGWRGHFGADYSSKAPHGPVCFCHGDRHQEPNVITEKDDCGTEWAYVFDTEEKVLHVLRRMRRDEEGEQRTVTGIAGFGVDGQYWDHVKDIDLKDAPALASLDYGKIECGENFERCGHYAYFHFPQLNGTDMARLGTQEYLGLRPLDTDVHSATAFIVNGKRVKHTQCGRRSPYHGYPAHWVASVELPDGTRLDVKVARDTKGGYKPVAGVAWVFPPTLVNPQETVVGGK